MHSSIQYFSDAPFGDNTVLAQSRVSTSRFLTTSLWHVYILVPDCFPQQMLLGSTPGTFFSLTKAQSRSQFSLWCAMMSPLLVGASMLRMSSFDLETYTNSEAIAVSQDPLAVQGSVIWGDCPRVSLMHKTPECGQVSKISVAKYSSPVTLC